MIASHAAIGAAHAAGDIVIDPIMPSLIKANSVDVRLGEWIWRRVPTGRVLDVTQPMPDEAWALERIGDTGIVLAPDERILGHTIEFIGARAKWVPIMHGKSTSARRGVSPHDDAGFGDVGYFNRWTFEIRNNDCDPMVLHWGLVLAQIAFDRLSLWRRALDYVKGGGRYQSGTNLDEIKRDWTPSDMLPKPMQVIR